MSRLAPFLTSCAILLAPCAAWAGTNIDIPVTFSEPVTYTGSPALNLDVGGVARKATAVSGAGTATLTFRYTTQAGDLDLDGISMSSPLDLTTPGGTITDLNGNALSPLTFTAPNLSGVKVDHPSLALDFLNNSYLLNGTRYASFASFLTAASGTYTRASTATYFDSAGNLQTAASGALRFDYDPATLAAKGILLEPQRTNSNTNSQLGGAGIGVWPTTWGAYTGDGLAFSVTATGSERNFSYVDVTLSGTVAASPSNTSAGAVINTGNIAASSGQIWTGSVYLRQISGTPATVSLCVDERNSGGTLLGNACTSLSPLTSALGTSRLIGTKTLSNASTAYVTMSLRIFYSAGQSFNTTFRIAAPQLELGNFATSYIPTTAGAATRLSDNVTIPTGAWYNQSAGSFAANISWVSSTGSLYPMFWRVDDGTGNNRWNLYYSQLGNTFSVDGLSGGVGQGSWAIASATSSSGKAASAQSLNSTNTAFNGVLKTLDTTWTPPPVTRLLLGTSSASYWVKDSKYYPQRVADGQLTLLSQ